MSITMISSCPATCRNYPHIRPKTTPHATPPLLPSPLLRLHPVKRQLPIFGLGARPTFRVRAESNGGVEGEREKSEKEKEKELKGESTMPGRFRPLSVEATPPPLRWPWFLAMAFLIYAWRLVLWELSHYLKFVTGIFQFIGYISKLLFALIYRFIGDPITYTIFYIETALHAIRSFYSSIVSSAPIPELTMIMILASTVVAIGEAASPNSVNHQSYLLTAAGAIGYAAVRGVISEPVFWLMLFGLFSFTRFIKKRDYVSSALPVATVLASVGEPWVRFLSIISFAALSIHHYSKNREQVTGEEETAAEMTASSWKVPFPLLAVALAIGIRVAAKWAGYRHLTWMIV